MKQTNKSRKKSPYLVAVALDCGLEDVKYRQVEPFADVCITVSGKRQKLLKNRISGKCLSPEVQSALRGFVEALRGCVL